MWQEWMPTVIATLATLIGTLVGSQNALSHRQKKIQRQQSAQIDALEQWVYDERDRIRQFNEQRATDPSAVLELPELPVWLQDAAREAD